MSKLMVLPKPAISLQKRFIHIISPLNVSLNVVKMMNNNMELLRGENYNITSSSIHYLLIVPNGGLFSSIQSSIKPRITCLMLTTSSHMGSCDLT